MCIDIGNSRQVSGMRIPNSTAVSRKKAPMITITVNGKLDSSCTDPEQASRRLDQIWKADPTARIELYEAGKSMGVNRSAVG